uniref:Crystaline entomocidal protoxin n=1 Tax=Bacillus thuringiensis subsp. aizawai TaxID=1433 RepID=Q7X3F7_BACTA|nr:putative mosquitocidal toxin [Bacillus thuringiensis serovar aizawai]
MNSYQNKNEYEILKSSPNNTNIPNRYPFANDRDMSPMSWNDCQGSPWNDVWESTASFTGIGIDLITFLGEPSITGINLLFSVIGKLLPSGQNVASLSICDLLSIIRKEVDESVLSDAYGDFNGVVNNYQTYYLTSLKKWLDAGKPTTGQLLTDVTKHFEFSEREFNALLKGSLSRPKGEILLLPTYTQGANLHLLLLRDFVQYKAVWEKELRTENVESELISPSFDYEGHFKEQLAEHINHCITWYQAGLNQIKESGTSTENWLKFNKFRREMTLSVLDIIAIFPTYDFENYKSETHIELSREVYTDPVGYNGWEQNLTNGFNTLEANGTRGPGLVTWLKKIDIFTDEVTEYSGWSPVAILRGWAGTRHYEIYTGSSNTLQRISGTTSNDVSNIDFINSRIFIITSLARYALAGAAAGNPGSPRYRVSRVEFRSTGRYTFLYEVNSPGISSMTIESKLPGVKNATGFTDYFNRLSNAACVQFGTSRVNVYGWTHISMGEGNYVYPNKITQIPAVKAWEIRGTSSVVAGPGHTGGNLVKMSYHSVWSIKFTCQQLKRYRVRIRYASDGNCQLAMRRWRGGPGYVQEARHTVQRTFSGSMTYDSFKYLDIFTMPAEDYTFDLTIDLESGGALYIDKIEFIPDDLTTLEYEEERNLEKTKNAVNDLFTN